MSDFLTARPRAVLFSLTTLALVLMAVSFGGTARAAAPTITLGSSADFAVLAGAGITNTGPTSIATDDADLRGDLGSSPADTITGLASVSWVLPAAGSFHGGDSVALQAQVDNVIAYDVAAASPSSSAIGGQLDGLVLGPGVHTASSALNLADGGTVILDAGGDPDAEFIVQVGSSLTMEAGSEVVLTDGAQACHVFWQVSEDATFRSAADVVGTVLAENAIVAESGASFEGRLLAQDASVTLDSNTFTLPGCTAPVDDDADTGTDVDADTDADADTGADVDADTDADADTDVDVDTDADADTDTDTGPRVDADSDDDAADVDADVDQDADVDAATDADSSTSDLPDTGGPSPLLVPVGLVGVVGGVLLLLTSRPRRGTHRA